MQKEFLNQLRRMERKLSHILQSSQKANISLDYYRSDELKRAARFWAGKEAGSYCELSGAGQDSFSPPDPDSLCYELLRGMSMIEFGSPPWIRREALERHPQLSPAAQTWHWVRDWLHMASSHSWPNPATRLTNEEPDCLAWAVDRRSGCTRG